MNSTRTSDQPRVADEDRDAPRIDDLVLGILLIVLGGIRVVIAFAQKETFGAEATIALITVCLGILLVAWRRSS